MKGTLYKEIKVAIDENRKKGDDPNIGKKVGSSTLLVEKIGQGAMGAVYLGYDDKLDRKVAVKVLLREMFSDEHQFEYLKGLLIQEGRNLARVRHSGIIVIHEVDADYPALIMEYIKGMDFQTFLYSRREQWGKTAFKKWFISKMQEVAEALRYAHSHGLIHKDLKLSNVMISRDEDHKWTQIKVIDFGLAQDNRRIKLTDGEVVLGTPSYMAPEQWEDTWELDRRTDVFAFGVMLYEVLMEVDFHVHTEIPQIKADLKTSGFLESRVGHLPIDQRTVFELLLAISRIKRAGGMLEVIGLLKSLQLSLTHREKEFPGTSFPKPPILGEEKKKVSSELKPRIKPPEKHEKTIIGNPSAEHEVVVEEPKPIDESIDVFVNNIMDEATPATRSKLGWKGLLGSIVLILLVGTIPYFYFRGEETTTKTQPTASNPVISEMKSAPMNPQKIPAKPVVITKITPPKPLPPKAPAKGQLPSLKYIMYLYQQEVTWCKKNDKYRNHYDQSRLWLTWCLRKRAMKMYMRDRENPETAIALLDEVKANMCFWEGLFRKSGKYKVKDLGLTKECKRIKSLIYKRFTYYISGKRLKDLSQYLQNRRSHRAKIRAKWKKTHIIPR
ncbi:serine/threonine protein kinase [bacterium]|nr:serine/threonine protein kinase [bacterium]